MSTQPVDAAAGEAGTAEWIALPVDALAVIVNSCSLRPRDVAALRTTCRFWRSSTDAVLETLMPGPTTTRAHFTSLPQRFPMLRNLDLRACDYRLFNHQLLYTDCLCILSLFISHLSAMPSLAHLTLSCEFVSEMGRKLWARSLCEAAFGDMTGPSGTGSDSAAPTPPRTGIGAVGTAGRASSGYHPSNLGPGASTNHVPQPPAAALAYAHGRGSAGANAEWPVSRLAPSSSRALALDSSSDEEGDKDDTEGAGSDGSGDEIGPEEGSDVEGAGVEDDVAGQSAAHGGSRSAVLYKSEIHTHGRLAAGSRSSGSTSAAAAAAAVAVSAHTAATEVPPRIAPIHTAPATQVGSPPHALSLLAAGPTAPQPTEVEPTRSADTGAGDGSATPVPAAIAPGMVPAVAPGAAPPGPHRVLMHPALRAIAGATGSGFPRSNSAPGSARRGRTRRRRRRQGCSAALSEGGGPDSEEEEEGYAAGQPGAAYQAQMWLPDWGAYLSALTSITIAPLGGRGAAAPAPPPRSLDPATNQPPVMRLWLRPRALQGLTCLRLAGVPVTGLGPELMTLTRLTRLDLSGCGLCVLPSGLSPWGHSLAVLQLKDNALRSLPQEVCDLTSLTYLDLSHNMLSSLPPTCLPTSLRTLLLHYNQLRDVPAAVTRLAGSPGPLRHTPSVAALSGVGGGSTYGGSSSWGSRGGSERSSMSGASYHSTPGNPAPPGCVLEILTLSHNWLGGVPNFARQLAGLTSLTRLELANVSDVVSGPLVVPAELTQLKQLRMLVVGGNAGGLMLAAELPQLSHSLTALDVREAGWSELPPSMSRLSRLRCLAAGGNALRVLPPWLPSLAPSLADLSISRNVGLRSLPEMLSQLTSLTSLDVSHCGLTELPGKVLGSLPRLTRLDASGNTLKHVPPALCSAPRLCKLWLRGCGLSDGAVRHAVTLLGRVAGPPVELHL